MSHFLVELDLARELNPVLANLVGQPAFFIVKAVGVISKKIGVSAHTYYRWRKEYGGMRVDQARRLKELDQENSRLKKLLADLSLDNAILKEASRGNF